MSAPRSLFFLALLSLTASGCSLCACRHPHKNVCDELNDRSLTSLVGYCPHLDLNGIGRQRWFQPASCVAEDRRQQSLGLRDAPGGH